MTIALAILFFFLALMSLQAQAAETDSPAEIVLGLVSHDIGAAATAFAKSAQVRSQSLAMRTEQTLAADWQQMLVSGVGCLVLFWVLVSLISRAIHDRVLAIELAKADAESGRQTAKRLIQGQQAANQELERLAAAVGDTVAKLDLSSPPADSSQVDRQPQKGRILMVEDNRTNQQVALGLLRKLGYDADAVTNGLAALEALQSIPYDVILMDCQMPEMDGYDATRTIRMRERSSDQGSNWKSPVHIIAITANAMQGDREKCLAAGMDDYVSKPIRLQELKAVLERWQPGTQNQCGPISASRVPAGEQALNSVNPADEAFLVPKKPEGAPVDIQRLIEVCDGPERIRELIDLYLHQSNQLIEDLGVAIRSGEAKKVEYFAHKYFGSSANCGMTAILPPLQELESMGRSGRLTGAEQPYADASRQLDRIKEFLTGHRF